MPIDNPLLTSPHIETKMMAYVRKPIPSDYHPFKYWLDECGYHLFLRDWVNIEASYGCYTLIQRAKIKMASAFLLERLAESKFKEKVIVYGIDDYETIPLSKLLDTYWDHVSVINGSGPYIGNINTVTLNGAVHLALEEKASLFSPSSSQAVSLEKHIWIEKPINHNFFLESITALINHYGWDDLATIKRRVGTEMG